jgi:UDP-N-acetylglucosamine 2-epimerase
MKQSSVRPRRLRRGARRLKIATIVDARPQFIESVLVSRELRKVATEVVVHTGQHCDAKMNEVFFEELNIPKAGYNLGTGALVGCASDAEPSQ